MRETDLRIRQQPERIATEFVKGFVHKQGLRPSPP
jgi:hypothetical protein